MTNPQFTSSVPVNYDRYLVPVLFQPYADSMAARVGKLNPSRVLELACGTGVVTQSLAAWLPAEVRIVATDVSQSMLDLAEKNLDESDSIEWQVADACALPFEDGSFDAIVCQFGAMFFPDKPAGMAEAFRVLAPGGHLLFSTWSELSMNPLFNCVEQTLSALLPEEETPIMPTPFNMSDPKKLSELVRGAGFQSVEIVEETYEVGPVEPASLAAGFAFGTPLGLYLSAQGHDLEKIRAALTAGYIERIGDPVVCSTQALACHATKA